MIQTAATIAKRHTRKQVSTATATTQAGINSYELARGTHEGEMEAAQQPRAIMSFTVRHIGRVMVQLSMYSTRFIPVCRCQMKLRVLAPWMTYVTNLMTSFFVW